MKMLHLLRHAKSSAKEDVEDQERPLSRRGRAAARQVGEHLPAKLGAVDLVLCSSARRTRETLDLVITEFSPRPRIMIEDELYLASAAGLAKRLRRLAAGDTNILVIGHNPGLHELAVALADKGSPNFRLPHASAFGFRSIGRLWALRATSWSLTSLPNRWAARKSEPRPRRRTG